MALLHYLRGILTLLLLPPLTLAVSLLTLVSIFVLRRSQRDVQSLPRWWGRCICQLAGARVRVEGLEHIAAEQTYIFVANHASQFDIFCFQGFFPHDFRWIAKKELFRIPFFGAAMRRAGFIAIDRSQGRAALQSLAQAAEKIAAGTSVLIFPEGTRSADGTIQPFKSGAIMLALKAGVPVVPIGFSGTYRALPKGKLLPQPAAITIRIGTPLATTAYKPTDKQKLAQELHDRVAELLSPDNR